MYPYSRFELLVSACTPVLSCESKNRGNAGTGAVTQVQTIRGLYQFGIGPFLVIIVIKEGMGRRPFDFTQRRLSAGQTENW